MSERRTNLELRTSIDELEKRVANRIVRQRVRLEWMRIVVLVVIVGSVWVSSFEGRSQLVRSQRIGCQRGKLDRAANATGWREAERARLRTATDASSSPGERASAREAASKYEHIAAGLEQRARIDCTRAYRDPGPFAAR